MSSASPGSPRKSATILCCGALAINSEFGIDTTLAIWLIGLTTGVCTIYGGLKAVVWSDMIQGAALILGGGAGVHLAKPAERIKTLPVSDLVVERLPSSYIRGGPIIAMTAVLHIIFWLAPIRESVDFQADICLNPNQQFVSIELVFTGFCEDSGESAGSL